jgi:hypothetical protein
MTIRAVIADLVKEKNVKLVRSGDPEDNEQQLRKDQVLILGLCGGTLCLDTPEAIERTLRAFRGATVTGFRFLVALDEAVVVCLMGAGGLMGDGYLGRDTWSTADVERAEGELLQRARAELEREGHLRRWRSEEGIDKITPDSVDACYAVIEVIE